MIFFKERPFSSMIKTKNFLWLLLICFHTKDKKVEARGLKYAKYIRWLRSCMQTKWNFITSFFFLHMIDTWGSLPWVKSSVSGPQKGTLLTYSCTQVDLRPQFVSITSMNLNGPKLTLMALYGPLWNFMDLTGPYWILLDLTGPYWTLLDLNKL